MLIIPNQAAKVVGELGFGQGVDVVGKVVTDAPDGAGVGVNGFGLQAFEFEVFEMRLVLPIEVRVGTDWDGDVHAGSSSRWVAKRLLVVVHTERRNSIRIISARKATRYEKGIYKNG